MKEHKQSDDRTDCKQTSRLDALVWKSKQRWRGRLWPKLPVVNVHHSLQSHFLLPLWPTSLPVIVQTSCTMRDYYWYSRRSHFQFDLQIKSRQSGQTVWLLRHLLVSDVLQWKEWKVKNENKTPSYKKAELSFKKFSFINESSLSL